MKIKFIKNKKLLLGLIPLVVTSIVTPLTIGYTNSAKQTQHKQEQQQAEEITIDNLVDIRQNALVNFNRLSDSQKQIIDKKINEESDKDYQYHDFVSKINAIFSDSNKTLDDRYHSIYSTSLAANISIVDYVKLYRNYGIQKSSVKNYSYANSSNNIDLVIEKAHKNYLLFDQTQDLLYDALYDISNSSSSLSLIKSKESIVLGKILSTSLKQDSKPSNSNTIKLINRYNVQSGLISIDQLDSIGLLKKGTDITSLITNNLLDIDDDNAEAKYNLLNYSKSNPIYNKYNCDHYELKAVINDYSFSFENGFWIEINYGLIEKTYLKRLDWDKYIVWSKDMNNNGIYNEINSSNSFKYYFIPSYEFMQKKVDEAFEVINNVMKPHLTVNPDIGIETYQKDIQHTGGEWRGYSIYPDKSWLLFQDIESVQAKNILQDFYISYRINQVDLNQKSVKFELALQPYINNSQYKYMYQSSDISSSIYIQENVQPSELFYARIVNKIRLLYQAKCLIDEYELGTDKVNNATEPWYYTLFVGDSSIVQMVITFINQGLVISFVTLFMAVIFRMTTKASGEGGWNWPLLILIAVFTVASAITIYSIWNSLGSFISDSSIASQSLACFEKMIVLDRQTTYAMYTSAINKINDDSIFQDYRKLIITDKHFPALENLIEFDAKLGDPVVSIDSNQDLKPMQAWAKLNQAIGDIKNNDDQKITNNFELITNVGAFYSPINNIKIDILTACSLIALVAIVITFLLVQDVDNKFASYDDFNKKREELIGKVTSHEEYMEELMEGSKKDFWKNKVQPLIGAKRGDDLNNLTKLFNEISDDFDEFCQKLLKAAKKTESSGWLNRIGRWGKNIFYFFYTVTFGAFIEGVKALYSLIARGSKTLKIIFGLIANTIYVSVILYFIPILGYANWINMYHTSVFQYA